MMWEENASHLSSNMYEPLKKENGAQPLGFVASQYSQHESSKILTDFTRSNLLLYGILLPWFDQSTVMITRQSSSSFLN